ncbi:MAG: MarC family protein, partial [Bacteroidales bacterium]|nr:MarC family protein [Bacteroidales bacterium]
MDFLTQINLVEILSSFIVLFVIIDVTGSIPIFLSLKSGDKNIKAGQACLIALLMFVGFFYAGDWLLDLFSIDVASFAVAGSFVIFILALEM